MTESVSSILTPWSSFYILTGSSAGALTGLMFVVITLVMGEERLRRRPEGIGTFSTPTVVHFCAALLVSAALSAPWRSFTQLSVLLGLAGMVGVVYILHLTWHMRTLPNYRADVEDWSWYSALPLLAYAAIVAGAIILRFLSVDAMFTIAGGVMLLIFIGIHNAWDIVTFIATGAVDDLPKPQ